MTNHTYPARFEGVDPEDMHLDMIPDPEPDRHLDCEWGNAEKCKADNTVRATWAGAALKAYAKVTKGSEPVETRLGDLLNDLRHLCDALELDFDELADSTNYDAEVRGAF